MYALAFSLFNLEQGTFHCARRETGTAEGLISIYCATTHRATDQSLRYASELVRLDGYWEHFANTSEGASTAMLHFLWKISIY